MIEKSKNYTKYKIIICKKSSARTTVGEYIKLIWVQLCCKSMGQSSTFATHNEQKIICKNKTFTSIQMIAKNPLPFKISPNQYGTDQ